MAKLRNTLLFGVLLSFLLAGSAAYAAKGGVPGPAGAAGAHGQFINGMPPGSAQGQKKGWQGGTAPTGWTKGQKTGWGGNAAPKGIIKK